VACARLSSFYNHLDQPASPVGGRSEETWPVSPV
jgi:hypothetical protein